MQMPLLFFIPQAEQLDPPLQGLEREVGGHNMTGVWVLPERVALARDKLGLPFQEPFEEGSGPGQIRAQNHQARHLWVIEKVPKETGHAPAVKRRYSYDWAGVWIQVNPIFVERQIRLARVVPTCQDTHPPFWIYEYDVFFSGHGRGVLRKMKPLHLHSSSLARVAGACK